MNIYEKNYYIKELIANLIKKINEEAYNDPYTANYMVNLFEQRILDLKSPYLSYVFAYYIKGANVKAHGEVVIEGNDPEMNYNYALNVKGADVKAHGKVVIESKDPEMNYNYALNVKGADVKTYKEIILASKDPVLCYLALGLDNEDFYPDGETANDIKRLDGLIKKINH